MARPHPQWDFYAGDVWRMHATILGDDGQPMDLTALLAANKIEWALINPMTNARVVDTDEASYVGIDPTEGTLWITVDDSVTVNVAPGRYEDVLRVIEADGPRTKWAGAVFVHLGMPPAA